MGTETGDVATAGAAAQAEELVTKIAQALEKCNERYDRLLENLSEEYYFFCHDAEGNFTYLSPSITRILGYAPEDYMRVHIDDSWTPNPINEKARLHTQLSLQGIRQPPYEMEIYHKNGSYRRFVTIETPIRDADGKVVAVEGTVRDVTDKKKIEEKLERYREHLEDLVQQRTAELQNSQKLLLDIIDFLPTPTYVIDRNRTIMAWNRAMANLFGVEGPAALGRRYREVMDRFHEGYDDILVDRVWGDDAVADMEPGGQRLRVWEERFLPGLNGGQGAHIWVAASPILDHDRRIVGAIESYRDVTEIKRAERRIRESERRLSTLMNNLPGMAYRLVQEGGGWQVDFVSSGCEAIFGYGPAFFLGKGIDALGHLIHPEDIERAKSNLEVGLRECTPVQNEYRIVTASQEIKWVFDRSEVLFDQKSEVVSIEGFISDFTFYKEMEGRLRNENLILRSSMRDRFKFHDIVGNCETMQHVYDLIMKAAATGDSVYVCGESGTGKELVARAIHDSSGRRDKPFVAVNCGAIPESLIESEFFGVRKGAFTGAGADKKGFLESASGGTLFLDEIGEISPAFQVKLLRAIEGNGFSPVGSRQVIKPDLRIVAASNRDLVELVRKGSIRNDFFYRIHVIPIYLPPLRERGDDLFLLIDHFLKQLSKVDRLRTFSREDLEILRNHDWPGNVRELQNVLRRYITFRSLDFMKPSGDPRPSRRSVPAAGILYEHPSLKTAMDAFEKSYIQDILQKHQWHRTLTAKALGVSRKTLFRKMQDHGLLMGHSGSNR